MTNSFYFFIILIVVLFVHVTAVAQPTGIFVLDNNQGTYRDANIRDYPFVDGFVWRTSWSEMETSKGVYSYVGLDHIIQKLDSINKKLTILFGAYSVEPAYIAAQSGVTTYQFINPISNITTTRAVPYDGYLLQRFRMFLSSLANHPVYSLTSKSMVALKNHPVLSNIATNIPGLGAIRNVNGLTSGLHSTLPNYARSLFVDSLIVSMKIQTDNFSTKNVFIPSYKNINDEISSPTLADNIKSKLLSTFDGVQNPKISFWQENLAGFTDIVTQVFTGLPTTAFATPMLNLENKAYTMFQMLQGWTTPFLDPDKTANSTPIDAMCYAYKTYGATYFELYVSDIDNLQYQHSFGEWDTIWCSTPLPIEKVVYDDKPVIYPNPSTHSISISGIGGPCTIVLFDLNGNRLFNVQNPSHIDISSLPYGLYTLYVKTNKQKHFLKFLKGG